MQIIKFFSKLLTNVAFGYIMIIEKGKTFVVTPNTNYKIIVTVFAEAVTMLLWKSSSKL